VMLAIPPSCMLWTRRGGLGKTAFWITTAAVLFAGDFPLAVLKTIADSLHVNRSGFGGQLLSVVLIRPESIALLAMGIFYLWTYLRCTPQEKLLSVDSSELLGAQAAANHGGTL